MSAKLEIDLDQDRINFEGAWLSRDDLAQRIQQSLAAGDFRISKLSEALEQLGQTSSGAKVLSLKLTAEQYTKLESAGARLGKSAPAFARELLSQVLGTAVSTSAANIAAHTSSPSIPALSFTPPPIVPVIAAPPPVVSAAGLAAAASTGVTPEEAAGALTITPKRRGELTPPPIVSPPAVTASTPTVVVDLGSPDADPSQHPAGGPGDGRRWFNRT